MQQEVSNCRQLVYVGSRLVGRSVASAISKEIPPFSLRANYKNNLFRFKMGALCRFSLFVESSGCLTLRGADASPQLS